MIFKLPTMIFTDFDIGFIKITLLFNKLRINTSELSLVFEFTYNINYAYNFQQIHIGKQYSLWVYPPEDDVWEQ